MINSNQKKNKTYKEKNNCKKLPIRTVPSGSFFEEAIYKMKKTIYYLINKELYRANKLFKGVYYA